MFDEPLIKSIGCYEQYKNFWKPILRANARNPMYYITQSENPDTDQCFCYTITGNIPITFRVDVNHIRSGFNELYGGIYYNQFFRDLTVLYNRDKRVLLNGEQIIKFNYYSAESRQKNYDDFETVFIMAIPSYPAECVIVDGNHRISALIDKGQNTIPAVMVFPHTVLRCFTSSFDTVTYAFLTDCELIMQNAGEVSEQAVKNKMFSFGMLRYFDQLKKDNLIS